MSAYKRSFAKTSLTTAAAGLFVIVTAHLVAPHKVPWLTALFNAIGWLIGGVFEAVAAGA
jgi:peptidoglycan biosynthesis protein MviN/MurJ (putative lipid II flippase)